MFVDAAQTLINPTGMQAVAKRFYCRYAQQRHIAENIPQSGLVQQAPASLASGLEFANDFSRMLNEGL